MNKVEIDLNVPPSYNLQRTMDEIDQSLFKLYTEEPLLGMVGLYLGKYADFKCKTAYVMCDKTHNLRLGFSPEFMSTLPANHKLGVLKHEYYHVIFMHILGRQPTDKNEWQCWNIAADLVVNYFVAHESPTKPCDPDKFLPSFALFPGRFPEKCEDEALGNLIKSLPVAQSAEWYFEKLKNFVVQQQQSGNPSYVIGSGGETLDDHSEWGEVDGEMEEVIRQRVEGILQEAINNAQTKNSWGSVPTEMQEILQKLMAREVDWRSIVRQFFGRARSTTFTSTVRRLNRRCPIILPGSKKKTHAKFAFFIDQSGSMSNEDVAVGFSEVSSLSGLTELDVYNFDTEVDEASHKVWKSGKVHDWGRTRCGGTDFNAVREFVARPENLKRWTGVVIYTDGYAAALAQMPPGIRVLWVITPGGSAEIVREGDLVVKLTGIKR